jgi:hypothetical protein
VLATYSIKDLYPLALAEGEGMGTAYEYYVKRMALARFLGDWPRPQSILIAGLPEKYGVSLDFLLLATELGARATVIDDRPAALERLHGALSGLAKMAGAATLAPPAHTALLDLYSLGALEGQFDLVLSSEVLQRLTPAGRATYVRRLAKVAPALALFCPNADNEAHNSRSGLGGLRLEEMTDLMDVHVRQAAAAKAGGRSPAVGFIDMPPFPPGITRSAAQREEATSGRFEALVMWGLGGYAHAERFMPRAARRRQSHIVYAFAGD